MDLPSIIQGEWLTDIHINAAQRILRRQFCSLVGFQNTLKSQDLSLKKKDSPYIQIVNVNGNHGLQLKVFVVILFLCMTASIGHLPTEPKRSFQF